MPDFDTAALELLGVAELFVDDEEVFWLELGVVVVDNFGVELGPVGVVAKLVVCDTDAPVPAVELPVPEVEPKTGAATAVEGSLRAPVPQGMAAPPGCVSFSGSVTSPVAEAIVKRVVH